PDRGVSLERDVVVGLHDLRGAGKRRLHVSGDGGRLRGCGLRPSQIAEELRRGWERRAGRLPPLGLQLTRALDGLLFALADDSQIVALADDTNEARKVSDG